MISRGLDVHDPSRSIPVKQEAIPEIVLRNSYKYVQNSGPDRGIHQNLFHQFGEVNREGESISVMNNPKNKNL
jgi:hypothetical protein